MRVLRGKEKKERGSLKYTKSFEHPLYFFPKFGATNIDILSIDSSSAVSVNLAAIDLYLGNFQN